MRYVDIPLWFKWLVCILFSISCARTCVVTVTFTQTNARSLRVLPTSCRDRIRMCFVKALRNLLLCFTISVH